MGKKHKSEYKFHEATQVAENFERLFHTRFKPFYDGLVSVLCKKIVIDVIKFDDYLTEKYHYSEKKEISMSAFILNQFGVEAWYFFKALMP